MANNYLTFSFGFNISPARVQQCRAVLQLEFDANEANGGRDPLDCWKDYGRITIEDDGLVWARSDENSDPIATAELCAKLLDIVGSDERVGFCYAYYCDKPRIDEFGGGAVVFDSTGVVGGENTHETLERLMTEGRQ